jgi:hypothetical protein
MTEDDSPDGALEIWSGDFYKDGAQGKFSEACCRSAYKSEAQTDRKPLKLQPVAKSEADVACLSVS